MCVWNVYRIIIIKVGIIKKEVEKKIYMSCPERFFLNDGALFFEKQEGVWGCKLFFSCLTIKSFIYFIFLS
jgi:hypothetical protein